MKARDDFGIAGARIAHGETWLELASREADVGRFFWSMSTGVCQIDETLARVIGFDYNGAPFLASKFISRIDEQDRAAFRAAVDTSKMTKLPYDVTFRFVRTDDRQIWLQGRGRHVILDDGSEAVVGVNYDITDVKRRIAHSDMVAGEMAHRNSNLLALVSGLFRMTAKGATSVKEMSDAFQGRLAALSTLNSNVFGAQRPSAFADEIADAVLGPIASDPRVAVTSGHVELNADAAQIVALTLNELMTNAVKYGGLSNPDGQIRIGLAGDDATSTFRLLWTERMPERVKAPDNPSGFGLKVLTELTANAHGGTPHVEWGDYGLQYSCHWPLPEMTAKKTAPNSPR